MDILEQAENLIALGALAGVLGDDEARAAARALAAVAPPGSLLVAHPRLLAPSALVGHLRLGDEPGFVVEDMTDLDDFGPTLDVPDAPLYALYDRGLSAAPAGRLLRRPHASALDRRRHRPRRRGTPRRPEGGLVLVAQPAHLAGVRVDDGARRGLTARVAA